MWEWLKKRWQWCVVGAIALGSFLLGILLRRRPIIVQAEDPDKKRVEGETKTKELEAEVKRDERKAEAQDDYDDKTRAVVEDVRKTSKELEGDTEAVNEYVKRVGDDVRGSK